MDIPEEGTREKEQLLLLQRQQQQQQRRRLNRGTDKTKGKPEGSGSGSGSHQRRSVEEKPEKAAERDAAAPPPTAAAAAAAAAPAAAPAPAAPTAAPAAAAPAAATAAAAREEEEAKGEKDQPHEEVPSTCTDSKEDFVAETNKNNAQVKKGEEEQQTKGDNINNKHKSSIDANEDVNKNNVEAVRTAKDLCGRDETNKQKKTECDAEDVRVEVEST